MCRVSIYELHERIVRDTFPDGLSGADALLVFSILHSYQVELAGPVLTDRPCGAGSLVPAGTQRECGSAIAGLWAGTEDRRAGYEHWYFEWNSRVGSPERHTAAERIRMRDLVRQIEGHPFVARLVPEDGHDPAAEPP